MSNTPESWLQKIAKIGGDQEFQDHTKEISSKSILKEIAETMPDYEWKYAELAIVRNASALSMMIQRMALEDPENLTKIGQSHLRLAELWESVARLKETIEPNFALMNAAVCYELAGYQANATCLARKISSGLQDSENSIELLSSMFLQRLFLNLRNKCHEVMKEPEKLVGEVSAVQRLGIAFIADAYLNAINYFLTGDRISIDNAEEQFKMGEEFFSKLFCIKESNLIRKTRSMLKLMVRDSTWNILGSVLENNYIWDRYLRLLARGIGSNLLHSTSISEVWPSQKTAIESDLFDLQKSKIIKMPTSAGKTRIAELAIVYTLAKNPGAKCVYVAPYRALVAELEDIFLNLFGDLGFRVSTILGTFEHDPFEKELAESADILIVTPEKLDLLLRSQDTLLDSVRLFILDEGHIIDNGSRGVKLELLLTRLKRKLPKTRFLFVSAVLSEETVQEYLSWFNSDPDDAITSNWRPSIQQHAKFEWSEDKNTGTMQYEARAENQLISKFVPKVAAVQTYGILNNSSRKYKKTNFPDIKSKSETAAELAFKFSKLGPVLVFATQSQWVDAIANQLSKRLELTKAIGKDIPAHFADIKSRSLQISKEWLGDEHPVTKLLEIGIAVHHGRIPDVLRRSIETDFREKRIRVVVSTNTLAQGVNLPIKTIIIHSCRRYENGHQVPIPAAEYWNIAGRAGRAGQETEGTTVHILLNPKDAKDYGHYVQNKDTTKRVKGALLKILQQITSEQLSEDMLREKIDAEILAMLVEEGGYEQFSEKIEDILKHSLVRYQVQDEDNIENLIQGFRKISNKISQDVPKDYLQIFSVTGMSSQSCMTLKKAIERNENNIRKIINSANSKNCLELLKIAIPVLETVSEMRRKITFEGDVFELLYKWMSGMDVNTIMSEQDGKKDDLAKFIDDYFGYLLPWGISSFLQITQQVLNLNNAEMPNEIRYLSSMVKYGVPTYQASWCMLIGIPFKRIAIGLSSEYISLNRPSRYSEFLNWMTEIDSKKLQADFGVENLYLEDISKKLFRVNVNPFLRNRSELNSIFQTLVWINWSKNEDGIDATYEIKVDDILELVRDYGNSFDRNAIKIFTVKKKELGFLDKNIAQFLAPYIDGGMKIQAEIRNIDPSNILNIQVQLKKI